MTNNTSGNGASAGGGARYRKVQQQQQDTNSINAHVSSSPLPSPPTSPSTVLRVPINPNHAASPDNKMSKARKHRRSLRRYIYPCLAAASAILILLIDMQMSVPRQVEAEKENASSGPGTPTPMQYGNDDNQQQNGQQQQQVMVRGSGPTPGRLKTTFNDNKHQRTSQQQPQQQQYPAEISLNSIGFLHGRKALEVGNRYRPHTDQEGNPLDWFIPSRRNKDNYDGLGIDFLDEDDYRRQILEPSGSGYTYASYSMDPDDMYQNEENQQWRKYDQYHAMDDDAVRSEVYTHMNESKECRVPDWYGLQFPTCNTFHEITIIHSDSDNRFLGRGYFRMAFSIKEKDQPWFILKVMRWRENKGNLFTRDRLEKTRMDSLVMERLAASPRITDMYGFCSASIMTEPLPGEVWEEAVPTERVIGRRDLHDKDDVDPKNPYTPKQKLDMALEMAEALADLHGFKDGMISHDDIDLGQYLRTPDGRMKLNDFNRAKPLLYDNIKGEYCKYYNGAIGGKFRAPEEFVPTILDEKIDIFSLGNCFYGLLTGLWPHYFLDNDRAQVKLVEGKMPYIDERYRKRSYAEGSLVRAIEMCHKREPEDRADIFAIVSHLQAAVHNNKHRDRIENQRPAPDVVKKYADFERMRGATAK